jgi:hypothetical protein
MAITLTITKVLILDYGEPIPLISAFSRQTIAFTVNWGGAARTAVTVESTIDGAVVVFTPVKTATNGTVDTFFFDFSDILKYVLGFPPTTYTVTGLTKSFVYAIKIAGSEITDGETLELCYITPDNGVYLHETWVYQTGSFADIYHNGIISFYNKNAEGSYILTLNGVDKAYYLAHGYNNVGLDTSHYLTGKMTSLEAGITLDLVYRYASTVGMIQWIDADGKWSIWSFRKLSEENRCESSNDIPIYASTNEYQYSKSRKIQKDIIKIINLDTIAVDEIHFNLLTKIANSPTVIYQTKVWEVESCSDSAAECKQNLNFKLSLKATQNAVSY